MPEYVKFTFKSFHKYVNSFRVSDSLKGKPLSKPHTDTHLPRHSRLKFLPCICSAYLKWLIILFELKPDPMLSLKSTPYSNKEGYLLSIEQTRPVIYDVIYEHGCCDVSVTTSLSATEAIFVEESKEEKKTRRQKIKTEKKNRCRQKKKVWVNIIRKE